MASTLSFSHSILSLLLLFLTSTTNYTLAENEHDNVFMSSPTLEYPKTQAERLIRALNLFPNNEVNRHAAQEHKFGASRIVEKQFKFPFLGDSGSSVKDLCYDFSSMEDFLNLKSVRDALGVEDIDFVSCSSIVYQAMVTDLMKNLEVGIPALLEDGIKLLVYAGEYDLICNWLGNSRWVHAMEWSGQKAFAAAPTVPFSVEGVEAGLQKGHGPLTFLKVHDAGHMVPMDQPKASLEMLWRWMHGKVPFTQEEGHLAPM